MISLLLKKLLMKWKNKVIEYLWKSLKWGIFNLLSSWTKRRFYYFCAPLLKGAVAERLGILYTIHLKILRLYEPPPFLKGGQYYTTYSTLEPISISSPSKHWITFSSFTSSTGSISGQLISGRIERKIWLFFS